MGALMDSPHFLAEASRDHAQEEAARLMANARIAIAPVWPTLAAAESPEDFDNRRELFSEQIAKACLAVAGNDLNAYTALLGQVQAQLEEDFNILHTAREAKKKEAAKTAGVYCKDHNVWIGDGNEATHEDCSKEQKATEKTKEGKQSPPFDREVAEREAARKEAEGQYEWEEPECELCGKPGHTIRSCPTRDDDSEHHARKTAVDRGTWQRDFDKYTQAIEAAGAVVDLGDGSFGVDKSKVPEDIVRGYRALTQMGYANGFLATKHKQAATWTNPWPSAPSVTRPGEQTIACPKCGSIDVTMTVAYGPGGRLGDPGSSDINICNSCGHREIMRTATRKQGWTMQQVNQVVERKQYATVDGMILDLWTASAIKAVMDALSHENRVKAEQLPLPTIAEFAIKHTGARKQAEDSGGKSRDDLQSMTDAQVKALWDEKSGSGETVEKLTKEMIRRGLFPPKQGKIAAFEVVDENDERVAGPFDTEEEAQGFIDQMGQDESDHGKDVEPEEEPKEDPKKGEFPPEKKKDDKGKGKPPWAKGSAVEAWLRNPREGARRMAQNPYMPENNPFVPAAPTTAPISQPGESGQTEDRAYPNEPGQPDPVTDPAEDQAIQGFSSREKVAAYAAKITEIADGIAQTNPSIDPREAVAIAHRTASLYPAVVAIEEHDAAEHEGMIDHRSRACANCGEMIYRRPGGVWLHTRTDDERCRGKWRQKVKWAPLEPA